MEDEQYQRSAAYYKDVQKQFVWASNDIQMDIAKWYQRLADNNGISYAEAKKFLRESELEEFQWSVERYITAGKENAVNPRWMKELENASARHHISYLEAMKLQVQQHAELLSTEFEGGITDFLQNSYGDRYYHTAFEMAKGTGAGSNLAKLDNRKVDALIRRPWAQDGANFSDRIWTNKEKLVNNLHTELSQNIIRGASPRTAINNLAKTMEVSKSQAGRLIMTESAAVSSAAQKDCLETLGVEQYAILATLDSHTSKICQSLDGKVFDMKDYTVGETAPPFHPWCRSTTVPYFDDEFSADEERAARDPETETGKTAYVDGNLKYPEWKEQFVDKKIEHEKVSGPPEHDKPIILESIDLSDKNMVLLKLKEYENTIADSLIENAVVLSRDGLIRQCFGDSNSVYPDGDIGEGFTGASVTHNHPVGSTNEYSFSKSDINLFMDHDLEILRGIDEKYIYELTRNPKDIDGHISIWDWDEYSTRHDEVISAAEKLGIGYRRYPRE